jgi:hypothetical protein
MRLSFAPGAGLEGEGLGAGAGAAVPEPSGAGALLASGAPAPAQPNIATTTTPIAQTQPLALTMTTLRAPFDGRDRRFRLARVKISYSLARCKGQRRGPFYVARRCRVRRLLHTNAPLGSSSAMNVSRSPALERV